MQSRPLLSALDLATARSLAASDPSIVNIQNAYWVAVVEANSDKYRAV